MKKNLMVACLVLFVPVVAIAQGDLESQRKNMDAVSFMVGEWVGEGWIAFGPEGPQKFRSREIVESRLGGLVLVIEGIHMGTEEGAGDDPVHHAVAVLSWDNAKNAYRFSSHLANGRQGDFDARFEGSSIVWGMDVPGRTIRYTITLDDEDRWTEVGESSTDGETWRQFFEMTLERVD